MNTHPYISKSLTYWLTRKCGRIFFNSIDMKHTTYPKAFSHIGITVPDLQKAIDFYTEVMGWYLLMGPETVKEEKETAIGQMCIDVFGEGWKAFRIAHLSTSDGVGIELFEFPH